MMIPYRTRRAFKRLFTVLIALVYVAIFVLLCWFLWLDRFLVYTKEGIYFDFSRDNKLMSGQTPVPTAPGPTVPVHYGDEDEEVTTELTQMIGYYITASDLSAPMSAKDPKAASAEKIDALMDMIRTLPPGTPVKLEVKNIRGNFFYSSYVSAQRHSRINTQKVDELISLMNEQKIYLIAELPAFRDFHFGLNNVPYGLHHSSGKYLWMDESGCYWLDPSKQGALTYLAQILTELRSLGFDEAVFSDFRIPESENILFEKDRAETLRAAAQTLVTACATDLFAVSFIGDSAFPLPEGRSRLYMEGISAGDCPYVAEETGLATPEIHLVFLAESHDTRYDRYSVLRPLDAIS